MKKVLIAAFILLSVFAGCHRRPARTTLSSTPFRDTLTLAFYNVENFFDFVNKGNEYHEYVPGVDNWTHEMQRIKVENLASAIAAMRAQVVGLCEVESRRALDDLVGALRQRGVNYPFECIGESLEPKMIYPALLSQIEIRSFTSIPTGTDHSYRPILEVHLANGPNDFIVFVNHWPSKFHPESFRVHAAQVLETRLKELPPSTDYVIEGDLNSDYDECVKDRFEKTDNTGGLTGLNGILKTARSGPGQSVQFTTETFFGEPSGRYHYDCWFDLPQPRRFNYIYKHNGETPDHILCPRSMFDSTGVSYCDKSFSVFTLDGKLLRDGAPFGWQMRFKGRERIHVGEGYSDHLPIFARFVNKPFAIAPNRRTPSAGDAGAVPDSAAAGAASSFVEGWSLGSGNFSICQDITGGRSCVKISGNPGAVNGCAARTVLQIAPRSPTVHFLLKGEGKLSLRSRFPQGAWMYFNGNDLKQSKSARYLNCRFENWKNVYLPVVSSDKNSELELEIRAGKGAPFCFRVSDVKALRAERE